MRPAMRRSSRATSRAMRSACQAPRSATSVPVAPCSGCACTRAWSSSTWASVSSSDESTRRAGGAAARRPRAGSSGSRGANGRGSSTLASRRIGPGEVVGGPAHHRALLGEREHPVAGAAPLLLQHHDLAAALRRHHDVAGPERVEPAGRAACAARRAASRPASSARYSSTSPLGCCAASRARCELRARALELPGRARRRRGRRGTARTTGRGGGAPPRAGSAARGWRPCCRWRGTTT